MASEVRGASAKRVTPLVVAPDIEAHLRQYSDLGFERVDSGDSGCVGMQAGSTAIIFATSAFMRRDFQDSTIARLEGRAVPYIHVESVEVALANLPAAADTVEDVRTRALTREVVVSIGADLMVLAETPA